ncbi:hypothetical protein [Mucilaginibacter psychrotolerans]|uniref:Uncharacterized protein n=1 Tax=Mucilaginibacter psychrotolerans TaxID=1524096 RepID=A0A4Y8S7X2_9SPHI|nr:hypothetical protein [Mucilaginibacter psychrotolerans]TFF35089.1 hypothetical protein E2R66_20315 [Mucilaginibacter psychrotolerans]
MFNQQLSGNMWFLVQPSGKQLRLIISDGTAELACRKESPGALKRFLASAETRLFKGRLQLRKDKETVIVVLKGEDVGVIAMEELDKVLI